MRFTSGIISSFLLVSAVVADQTDNHEHRHPKLSKRHNSPSSLWAGVAARKDNGFLSHLSATFEIPTVKDLRRPFDLAVTLDGFTGDKCPHVYVRAGVEIKPGNNGQPSCTPYYEWYPGPKGYLDLSISPLQRITVALIVNTTTLTWAAAIVQNHSTGGIKGEEIQVPQESAICGRNGFVGVGLENVGDPLANFGTVEFEVDGFDNSWTQLFDLIPGNGGPIATVSGNPRSFVVKHV